MFKTIDLKSKSKFTLGKFLFSLFIISIIIVLIIYGLSMMPVNYYYKDTLLEYSIIGNYTVIGLLILNMLHYVFLSSRNKGQFIGIMELKPNEIILNNNTYPITEISELRFKGNDIKGDFRGYFSQGKNNEIIIKLENGEIIVCFFQQTKDQKLKNQETILNLYNQRGILSSANLENILGNTNYY